ncbi:hypothetical protein F4808DRAFT_452184 [Astrocystis sublimbata]|nr:hypothetical protein F4808DRAFT_452184 [Astrocystis sublimbata]
MATAMVESIPSCERGVPGSVNIPIAPWPATATDYKTADANAVSTEIIDSLNQLLERTDYEALANLFIDNGYWRDHLGLTWDFRTAKGKEKIVNLLQGGHHLVRVEIDHSPPGNGPQITDLRGYDTIHGIQFFITTTTQFGSGRGLVRLVQESGQWKIWTLYATMEKLKGYEEAVGPNRPSGVQHGARVGKKNWVERRQIETELKDWEPDVLVVGCGQAGLSISARLKMLQVPTLTIDCAGSVGAAWRSRYHQLVLHDPVWYDHMPYIHFPETWPVFTPKDKMADFLQSYAHMLELNVWTQTHLKSSVWDDTKKQWTVVLERIGSHGISETRTLHPKHIIQATGHSGKRNYPNFKGMESFKGSVLCHSSEFREPKTSDADGRKAVIIGSCNSALDIAQDYYENGYDVTIVQRSSTAVISSESVLKHLLGGVYCEGGPPVEVGDLISWSLPQEVSKAFKVDATILGMDLDKETHEGLNRAGFKTDKGPMDAGMFFKYLQRGGGYYIDVGTTQLIIDGSVKVKHGHEIEEILPNGLRLADGTELEADEIICATGYQNMRTMTEAIFGSQVASKVGNVWGFDEEGETRIMWRQSGHPGLWLHGGNLAMCRYFSRLVALQIKAQLEGLTS